MKVKKFRILRFSSSHAGFPNGQLKPGSEERQGGSWALTCWNTDTPDCEKSPYPEDYLK